MRYGLSVPGLMLCVLWAAGAIAGDLKHGAAIEAGAYAKAFALVRPLAVGGNAQAEYLMGRMYAQGQGVPEDDYRAYAWYRKAADAGVAAARGFARAELDLGNMYALGQGVKRDEAQALSWARKAAGHGDMHAQDQMGDRYADGNGVPKDKGKAVAWYRKAAAQGDRYAADALQKLEEGANEAHRNEDNER